MGGTTSNALPDRLDVQECSRVCGDKFKPEIFDSLKGEDGLVEKEAFIRYVQLRNTSSLSTNSQHVRDRLYQDIFRAYAYPNKSLSMTHYMQLLKDLRWMNAKFPSAQAAAVFERHVTSRPAVLSYDVFKKDVLSDIATQKEWTMKKLLERLSHHDSTIMAAYVERKYRAPSHMTPIAEGDRTPAEWVESPVSPEQRAAAIKLQNMMRQKTSSKLLKELRNVKNITPDSDIFIVVDKATEELFERKLQELFRNTCKPHRAMLCSHFKTILSYLQLCDLSFTSRDADVAFHTIVALALHPNAGTYARGVTFGKAIDFNVFREIGLPFVADKKGVDVKTLKSIIAENVDVGGSLLRKNSSDSSEKSDPDGGVVVE